MRTQIPVRKIMNFKFCLLAFVMLIASPAMADWSLTTISNNGDRYYIDLETIRKSGSLIRVWELNNFAEPREFANIQGVSSTRYRAEYDCKNERLRFLTLSAHAELDAKGKVLGQDSKEGNWVEIPPNTTGRENLKVICKFQ